MTMLLRLLFNAAFSIAFIDAKPQLCEGVAPSAWVENWKYESAIDGAITWLKAGLAVENGKRQYKYVCILGKGNAPAFVARVKVSGVDAAGEQIAALKISVLEHESLKNEAIIMTEVHNLEGLSGFVPKPNFHGYSENKAYYLMEMVEVGPTLLSVMAEPPKAKVWKAYFKQLRTIIKTLHGKNYLKCYAHGDPHFGNIVLNPKDTSKILLIDWGQAQRCAKPDPTNSGKMVEYKEGIAWAMIKDIGTIARDLGTCFSTTEPTVDGKEWSCFYAAGVTVDAFPAKKGEKLAELWLEMAVKKPTQSFADLHNADKRLADLIG